MQKLSIPAVLLAAVPLFWSVLAAAQQPQPPANLGQIGGIVAAPDGGTLPNALAQLRDLDTGEVIGVVATTADGQFVFAVAKPGNYAVEILNAQGVVVATTAAITLTPAAMVVRSVAITAPPSAGNSAASAAAAGGGAKVFSPTAPYVSNATGGSSSGLGSSVIPGIVPSKGTQSPSR